MADETTGATAAPEASTPVETATPSADLHSQMQSAIESAPNDFALPTTVPAQAVEQSAASETQPAAETAPNAAEATTEVPEDTDLWSYLQSLKPGDVPAEPTAMQQLEAALAANPTALAQFQALAQEQAEMGQTWQTLTERMEPYGGAEALPKAVEVYTNMLRGSELLENGMTASVQAGLTLFEENPTSFLRTTGNFMRLAMGTPETRQTIVEFVLKSEGLNPQFIKDYKNVTLDGGYRPVVNNEAKMTVLEGVNKLRTEREKDYDYVKAFQRLPEKMQFQLTENPDDAEFAKYLLDKEARDILNDQREEQARSERAAQMEQQLNWDSSKESNNLLRSAVSEHVETLMVQGIPEHVAKANAFDALMDMWAGYFEDGSPYAKTEADIIAAYKKGDKSVLTTGKEQYFKVFEGPLKARLSKTSVKAAGILPKKTAKQPGNPPPDGQFPADANPQVLNSHLSPWERMQAVFGNG